MAISKNIDLDQKVKVKLNTRMACPDGVFAPGSTIEMALGKAVELVAARYAEFDEPEKYGDLVAQAEEPNAAIVAKRAEDKAAKLIEKAEAKIEKVKAKQSEFSGK